METKFITFRALTSNWEKLKRLAAQENRSVSKQINHIIEEWLKKYE